MKITQFRILVAIKKYGSLSQAARKLYISQPSISTTIKSLEMELGYPILSRNSKGVSFTPKGKEVLQSAEIIINEVDKLLKTADAEQTSWDTTYLAAPFHLANVILSYKMQLEKQYPLFSLWHEGNDDADLVLQQLEDGKISIGIVNSAFLDDDVLSNGAYNIIELNQDTLCVIVRDEHPLASQQTVSLHDLLTYPYLTYRESKLRRVQKLIRENPSSPEIVHATDNVLIRRMLFLSDAWSVVTQKSFDESNSFYQHNYASLPVDEIRSIKCSDYIVYKKDRLSKPEQILVSALTSYSYHELY